MATEASAKGFVAHEAGNYTNAIRHYTEAINHEPNNATHYANRSNTYYQLQQFSQALTDAKQAINLKPNGYVGYRRLGAAYYSLKQYDDAVSAYNKGLEVDPNNVGLKYALANVQATIKAQAELDAARSSGPLNADPTTRLEDLKDRLGTFKSLAASATTFKQLVTQQNAIQQHLIELLESQVNQVDSFSVKAALGVLNRMVDDGLIAKGCHLWCVATDLFEDAGKRELFISIPDDDGRMAWLKHITKKN